MTKENIERFLNSEEEFQAGSSISNFGFTEEEIEEIYAKDQDEPWWNL